MSAESYRQSSAPMWVPNRYPAARRSDHIDEYESKKQGGLVKIHDPYQWLESHTEETTKWIEDQVRFTEEYLEKTDRDKLKDLFFKTADFAKFSSPSLKGDNRWYWYYNSGLQAQSVLYRSLDDKLPNFSRNPNDLGGEIFFDPNLLRSDGTAAITTTAFSNNGEYFAYGVSLSGSDFFTIYVRKTSSPFHEVNGQKPDINDGVLETLRFAKFSSISWTHDNKGFFYQRFPEKKEHGDVQSDAAGTGTGKVLNAMLMYHRIGTSQSNDLLVCKNDENPEWRFRAAVTDPDGKYVALYIFRDTARKHKLYIADLSENEIGPNMKWNKLVDEFDAEYSILGNDGPIFYFQTNKDADREKVVRIDISKDKCKLEEIIPQDPEAKLARCDFVYDHFVVVYSRNVHDELYIYSKSGERLCRLAEDFVGTISISSKPEQPWFFATTTGFTTPGIVYHYDFNAKNQWNVYRTTQVKGLDPNGFIAEQVWFNSKDGTRVPMFIVRDKSVKKDGTASAIQYGYGGFSSAVRPFFSSTILSYIKSYGAILAVPGIRGGSEFGEEWHLAATRERKKNCFDDFIAATEYLTSEKWVAPGKVAINGASNGGLLVAACLNRASQGTFGAGVAEVGVMDLLKFADFTIGKAWTSDFGDPHNPEDFDFIYPIPPLHNVPDHELPPTILLTADHDDRVVPLHTFKLAATLQHKLPYNPHPLLVRIEQKAGHGAGKSTEKRIKEAADKWSFVARSMGLQWKDINEDATDSELAKWQQHLLHAKYPISYYYKAPIPMPIKHRQPVRATVERKNDKEDGHAKYRLFGDELPILGLEE